MRSGISKPATDEKILQFPDERLQPCIVELLLHYMRSFSLFLLILLVFNDAGLGVEVGARIKPVEVITLDGRSLTMTNYSERRGTVIVFMSARDGAGQPETQTISDLSSRYRLRGVLFVGVFPNEAESPDEIRRFAQRQTLLFPVYRDVGRKAVQEFGATVTPEAFLLDSSGVVIYHGNIGNTNGGGLAEALSAFSSGKTPGATFVPAKGAPVGQAQLARQVSDPFASVAFSSELLFEKIPDVPAHHCSTIAEAGNGDLVVVWYGGSYESSDDQALFLSRRKKGSRDWSAPKSLIRDSLRPPGNAVVFPTGKHRLCIVWARMEASRPLRRGGGWGETRLLYRISEDDGFTWSKDELFLGGVWDGLRNAPIVLTNGRILLPLGRSFASTKDGGRTWEHLGTVGSGGQPTLIERADHSLLTLLRKGPRILESESRDGGLTWSQPVAIALKNPNSGIAMRRLQNGHAVLVFNDSETSRTPLSIARSLDEGKTWEIPLALESNPGEYSYPCVVQDSAGRLHITYTFRRYTIKHVELDENWLNHLHRPN